MYVGVGGIITRAPLPSGIPIRNFLIPIGLIKCLCCVEAKLVVLRFQNARSNNLQTSMVCWIRRLCCSWTVSIYNTSSVVSVVQHAPISELRD